MKLEEIKQAIEDGKPVHWSNTNYKVIKDSLGQYLIHSQSNNHYIGLTHMDNVTLNGKEEEFFTEEQYEQPTT